MDGETQSTATLNVSGAAQPGVPINFFQYATYVVKGRLIEMPVQVAGDQITLQRS